MSRQTLARRAEKQTATQISVNTPRWKPCSLRARINSTDQRQKGQNQEGEEILPYF